MAFISVLLGLIQILDGPESALRFYSPFSNPAVAVGFYQYRNNYAALLYSAMPIAAACAAALVHLHRLGALPAAVFLVLVYGVLIFGLVTALSRAGLLLGLAAGAGSAFLIWTGGLIKLQSRAAVTSMLVALIVAAVAHFGLLIALGERETLTDETRADIYATTLRAASSFFPWGSGIGTFVPAYAIHEAPELISEYSTNHAHNDWLELWLEAGVPAALLVIAFLIWLIHASVRAWRPKSDERRPSEAFLPRAASLVVLLLMLHSAADYPLRASTNLVIFAMACALLVPPVRRP
jgi:O-antigen ligase